MEQARCRRGRSGKGSWSKGDDKPGSDRRGTRDNVSDRVASTGASRCLTSAAQWLGPSSLEQSHGQREVWCSSESRCHRVEVTGRPRAGVGGHARGRRRGQRGQRGCRGTHVVVWRRKRLEVGGRRRRDGEPAEPLSRRTWPPSTSRPTSRWPTLEPGGVCCSYCTGTRVQPSLTHLRLTLLLNASLPQPGPPTVVTHSAQRSCSWPGPACSAVLASHAQMGCKSRLARPLACARSVLEIRSVLAPLPGPRSDRWGPHDGTPSDRCELHAPALQQSLARFRRSSVSSPSPAGARLGG